MAITAFTLRFKSKDYALIQRAAKAENRSVTQYMLLALVQAAKATLAMQAPSNVFAPRG